MVDFFRRRRRIPGTSVMHCGHVVSVLHQIVACAFGTTTPHLVVAITLPLLDSCETSAWIMRHPGSRPSASRTDVEDRCSER